MDYAYIYNSIINKEYVEEKYLTDILEYFTSEEEYEKCLIVKDYIDGRLKKMTIEKQIELNDLKRIEKDIIYRLDQNTHHLQRLYEDYNKDYDNNPIVSTTMKNFLQNSIEKNKKRIQQYQQDLISIRLEIKKLNS